MFEFQRDRGLLKKENTGLGMPERCGCRSINVLIQREY